MLELLVLVPILLVLYCLGIDRASALMGKIAQLIGPHTKASKVAQQNLIRCFPNFSPSQQAEIINKMWDNLGRIVGELLHWHRLSKEQFFSRVEIHDYSNGAFMHQDGALVLSGHYGNWEIYPFMFKWLNIKCSQLYRPANNPSVNYLINYLRSKSGVEMLIKGLGGMREALNKLKNKEYVGMLVDQKTNNGIIVPFFGELAPTTPAPANLAIKYGYPIFMTRVIRLSNSARYRIEITPIMQVSNADTAPSIMHQVNFQLEKWIIEYPEQWFWVHRRWGKDFY